jgi:branched-chain amino acid transport system ATP-binding protein
LTALENVRLAVQSRADAGWSMFKVWNARRDLIEKAESVLERVRLADKRHVAPKALSHGDQRKLEVALLIAMEPKVFMFDEPTAGMSVDEVPTVLELIHDIKQRSDATVLLVEHKMDVVRSLSDRIIVLHNGVLVADGEPAEVIASPVVQEAYLGVEAARG